ncbi:MAG TPA: hypothetical protein VD788_14540 [Candidatus Polarisedimenticolaceae bacterium]|nr:hypothetical protein [Candidatus Polarisedimenticolaceae bacterium]
MERDKQQLESLHQQASILYLQGEYLSALDAWSRLLEIDPADERAREGARMCRALVQDQNGPAGATTATGGGPAADGGVGFGFGEDLDEELEEIDEMLAGGKPNDWMDEKSQASPSGEETFEFDLSDVTDETRASIRSAAPSPDEFEFDVESTDRQATVDHAVDSAFDSAPRAPVASPAPRAQKPPAAPAPPVDTGRMAAEELQNRTNELMAEALEFYEQGDRAAALAALARLEILDEGNEAGKTFAAHIRAEMAQSRSSAAPPVPAEVPFEPEAPPAPVAGTQPSMPAVRSRPDPAPIARGPERRATPVVEPVASIDDFEEIEIPEAGPAGDEPRSLDPPPRSSGSAVLLPSPPAVPRRWLLIVAGCLVVVASAFVALRFFGGGPSPDANAQTQLAAPPALSETAPPESAEPAPAAASEAEAPPPAPVAVDRAALDELVARGDDRIEAGDFAAAVLAYNEALKLDPENEILRRRLREAGELFREQQATLEQRAAAIEAFNNGDYQNALRIFYRIPPVDDAERSRFTRYRVNGWYNMGLRALKSGDCRTARSHFEEARTIDALDPGLRDAVELTATCFEGTTQSYFDVVRGLNYRGLDD